MGGLAGLVLLFVALVMVTWLMFVSMSRQKSSVVTQKDAVERQKQAIDKSQEYQEQIVSLLEQIRDEIKKNKTS